MDVTTWQQVLDAVHDLSLGSPDEVSPRGTASPTVDSRSHAVIKSNPVQQVFETTELFEAIFLNLHVDIDVPNEAWLPAQHSLFILLLAKRVNKLFASFITNSLPLQRALFLTRPPPSPAALSLGKTAPTWNYLLHYRKIQVAKDGTYVITTWTRQALNIEIYAASESYGAGKDATLKKRSMCTGSWGEMLIVLEPVEVQVDIVDLRSSKRWHACAVARPGLTLCFLVRRAYGWFQDCDIYKSVGDKQH